MELQVKIPHGQLQLHLGVKILKKGTHLGTSILINSFKYFLCTYVYTFASTQHHILTLFLFFHIACVLIYVLLASKRIQRIPVLPIKEIEEVNGALISGHVISPNF